MRGADPQGVQVKRLSVIVPVYNVEKYLEQCLTSLLVHEMSDELEVIIIDDGSTDRSPLIAGEYQRKYPGLFRYIRKENGGHGSAINRGIREASGLYFKVVDGDDWVETSGLVRLIGSLKRHDADLVLTDYQWVSEKNKRRTSEVAELCPGILYEIEYPAWEVLSQTFLKMHAMTYKTSLLREMPVRLDENSYYVDMEYVIYPLPYVRTALFLREVVYQYRVGISGQSMAIGNMQRRCAQHERVLDQLLIYFSWYRTAPCAQAMAAAVARMAVSQFKIYLSFQKSHKRDLAALDGRLREEYPEIYRAVRKKAILALRLSHYHLYGLFSLLVRSWLAGGRYL